MKDFIYKNEVCIDFLLEQNTTFKNFQDRNFQSLSEVR